MARPALRPDLIGRGVGYVLAVSRDDRVITGIGARRAVEIAGRLPEARVATAIRRVRRQGRNASTTGPRSPSPATTPASTGC
jgi:hypothetical protein